MNICENSILIAPSLMAANMLNLGNEAQAVRLAGADWLHIDVMDGHFVPNITFGPDVVNQLRTLFPQKSDLEFDVHLMVENVELFINLYQKVGADRITIHSEATVHLHRFLVYIQEVGCKAGVSINPGTPINQIYQVLNIVDQVLVMGVNPGFCGQKFITSTLEKIQELSEIRRLKGLEFQIIVDGGVTTENSSLIIQAGADVLVAGNSIFKNQNYANAITNLRTVRA